MMSASRARKVFVVAALVVVAVTAVLTLVFPYGSDPGAKVVWYKRVPAFAAMLGFFGCVIMVPAVKTLAKKVLQRPDDYYSAMERRLAELTGPAPGTSLADPSAPSEAESPAGEEPGEPGKAAGGASAVHQTRVAKGGGHG